MDIDFKLLHFRLNHKTKCKLFSLFKKFTDDPEVIQKKITVIVNMWRLTTYKYMSNNLFELEPVRVQYLRNCLPSIGAYDKSKYTLTKCNFYSCPWCWLRKYSDNTYGVLKEHKQNFKDTKFYYMINQKTYSKKDYRKAHKEYSKLCDMSVKICQKFTRRVSVLGGLCLTFVEPNETGFCITTRLLVSSLKPIDPPEGFKALFVSESILKVSTAIAMYPMSFIRLKSKMKGFCFFLKNKNKHAKSFIRFGKFFNRRRRYGGKQ